jgi:hypothetical protein
MGAHPAIKQRLTAKNTLTGRMPVSPIDGSAMPIFRRNINVTPPSARQSVCYRIDLKNPHRLRHLRAAA